MAEARHGQLTTAEGIHIPYQWTYADTAARTGATGFVAADVGKLARQLDDDSLYMLTATTPTWTKLTGLDVFTGLADVPSSYSGEGSKHVAVNVAENALEFVTPITAALDLSDFPASYSGQSGKYVAVNATEDGLEFL